MNDIQNVDKARSFVQVVGVLFAVSGGISFVSTVINWSATSPLTLVLTLGIYFLMFAGGGLLLAFRRDGLEIVFMILRLYFLFGLGTIASGVITTQSGTVALGCSILVIVIGLMIFLSQKNVKALFEKKG